MDGFSAFFNPSDSLLKTEKLSLKGEHKTNTEQKFNEKGLMMMMMMMMMIQRRNRNSERGFIVAECIHTLSKGMVLKS